MKQHKEPTDWVHEAIASFTVGFLVGCVLLLASIGLFIGWHLLYFVYWLIGAYYSKVILGSFILCMVLGVVIRLCDKFVLNNKFGTADPNAIVKK